MMCRILFLARADFTTLERYINVAAELRAMKMETILLEIEPHFRGILRNPRVVSGVEQNFSTLYRAEGLRFWKERLIARIYSTLRSLIKGNNTFETGEVFSPKVNSMGRSAQSDLFELIDNIGMNTQCIVERAMEQYESKFIALKRKAFRFIDNVKPSAIIYDIEFGHYILAMLYEAKCRGIPIWSMQHAGGYCRAYSMLPVLADYYIAYNKHNFETIQNMGVNESRIYLTGAPETGEVIEQARLESTIRAAGLRQNDDFKKTTSTLLVALKPCDVSNFRRLNRRLLTIISEVFDESTRYEIIVKRHPSDKAGKADLNIENIFTVSTVKVVLAETEVAIEKMMRKCDFLISFMSSCVVGAISIGIPVCLISDQVDHLWPDYEKHKAFCMIEMFEVRGFLTQLRNGEWPDCAKATQEKRRMFLDEFGMRHNSKNAKNIAVKIVEKMKGDSQ